MAYSTIPKGSLYMNTKIYTGNGSTNALTGIGFAPDWVWFKSRSNADDHNLFDKVRGVTKCIETNTNVAEFTQSNGLTAFDTDGFTVGNFNAGNRSGGNIVAWNWKANGAGSANTDGSITSTVSANTTSGFSIATWTGTGSNGSVGHGLGGVDFMIIKDLSNNRNWYTWNKTFAYNDRIKLDTTSAKETGTDNMTALPDSTKINMATSTQNNGSSQNYVGYFFQEKTGYSKFGSYTGNGNADGPFIYTGFKPAFVMTKKSSGTGAWAMMDNKRPGYNVTNNYLQANDSATEYVDVSFNLDLLSNGWKARHNNGDFNSSGQTYIYMAFASNPFVATSGSSAVPVTAR